MTTYAPKTPFCTPVSWCREALTIIVTFRLKIDTPVIPALGIVHASFSSCTPFRFRVRSPQGTEGREKHVLWPIMTDVQ